MQVKLVMADDDATPSNPPVEPVQQEEFKEASLDLNVFQRPREEEPPRRVVRTRVDRSVWDRQLSPNPDDDVRFHCRTWVPGDDHYRWLRVPINPLPLEHRAEYLARTIRRILDFLQM